MLLCTLLVALLAHTASALPSQLDVARHFLRQVNSWQASETYGQLASTLNRTSTDQLASTERDRRCLRTLRLALHNPLRAQWSATSECQPVSPRLAQTNPSPQCSTPRPACFPLELSPELSPLSATLTPVCPSKRESPEWSKQCTASTASFRSHFRPVWRNLWPTAKRKRTTAGPTHC